MVKPASCPPHHWVLGSLGKQLPNSRGRGHWLVEREAECRRCGETKMISEREFTDDGEGRYAGGGAGPRHDDEWLASQGNGK